MAGIDPSKVSHERYRETINTIYPNFHETSYKCTISNVSLLFSLYQIKAMPLQKTILAVNNFVINTTSFLNHFSNNCEHKLAKISGRQSLPSLSNVFIYFRSHILLFFHIIYNIFRPYNGFGYSAGRTRGQIELHSP